jgi:hypothetical protein
VWNHLDAFIAMQDYIDHHTPKRRPAYNEITSAKAKSAFKDAFANTDELMKPMKEARSSKSSSSTGLWPLDFHSYHDWRTTTHVKKVYTEYIVMARIEIAIIQSYRPKLFEQCPSALFIRAGIAALLNDTCTVRQWSVRNPDTLKYEMRHVRRFVYADKVPYQKTTSEDPPAINVIDLKLKRQRAAKSEHLASDAIVALKKIESLKGAAAHPGSKELDIGVYNAMKLLRQVTLPQLIVILLIRVIHNRRFAII